MIMVRLMGGLGNQMFQYAAALRLAMKHHTDLKVDLTFLLDRTPRKNFTYRDFDLVIFHLPLQAATEHEVRQFRRLVEPGPRSWRGRLADYFSNRRVFLEQGLSFDPRVLGLPNETYLEGYFQDERYFADIEGLVRERFCLVPDETALSPHTRQLAKTIRDTNAICIHVRRGDYVSNSTTSNIHGVCSLDYYKRGLAELRSRGVDGPLFIFSDDEAWCRSNFRGKPDVTVVGQEHAGVRASTHLWLMTLCNHFVLANSSFSWWAAWLSSGPDKCVVRPMRWFNDPKHEDADICPREWVPLSNTPDLA